MTAGTHTSAPPSPGTIDRMVITVPQKMAPSMPATQNARPEKEALDDADEDRALERGARDRHEPLEHQRLVRGRQRHVPDAGVQQRRPVDQEEEHRVEQHDEVKDEDRRGDGRGRQRHHQKASDIADDLRGPAQDLLPVGLDQPVARHASKPLFQRARVAERVGQARAELLRHSQRLVGPRGQHRDQRYQDQQQHHDQRGRGGEVRPAAEPAGQARVGGIGQSREDGREQDRQGEGPDHRQERGRDGRDQEDQERMAETLIGHNTV